MAYQARQDLLTYLRALPASSYRVNYLPSKGRTGNHVPWDRTASELIKQRPGALSANTTGMREIYARPYDFRYIMVDDVSPSALEDAIRLGPALVVETSEDNYQVWYISTSRDKESNEALSRALVRRLGADAGATGAMQLARLPGFFNRKPNRHKFLVRVLRRGYRIGQKMRRFVHSPPSSPAPSQLAHNRPGSASSTADGSGTDFRALMMELEATRGRVADSELVENLRRWSVHHGRLPNAPMSPVMKRYALRTVGAARRRYRFLHH